MRIAVITACFGDMDSLKSFPDQTNVAQYDRIFISEKNSAYPLAELSPRMKGRFFKTQSHKLFLGYDLHVWLDANVQIVSSTFLAELVTAVSLAEADVALRKHPERDSVFTEANFIADKIRNGSAYLKARYEIDPILMQVQHFAKAGHPTRGAGLYWLGIFARRINRHTNTLFDALWNQCLCWSNYDQNAFAFLADEFETKIAPMEWGSYYKNPTYELVPHAKLQ
jgi:hypothetical protein